MARKPNYLLLVPFVLTVFFFFQSVLGVVAPEQTFMVMLIAWLVGVVAVLAAEYLLLRGQTTQREILLGGLWWSMILGAVATALIQGALLLTNFETSFFTLPGAVILASLLTLMFFTVFSLGNVLIVFKHYDAALKLNNLLLKLPFRKLSGHVQRGNIYQHHLKQLDKALIEYEAALRHARKPGMKAVALSWHSNVLTETLQMERALQDANAIIALNVHQDVAHQIRSYIHFYLGDNEAAHADIETGLQHSKTPGFEPMLIAMRGLIYAQEGDFDTAHADFKQALKGVPEAQMPGLRSVIYQYIGRTYFAQSEYDAALTAFNKAQDAEPEMTAILIDQAVTQAALGEQKLARQLWHMAAETDARLVTDISWLAQRNYFWCPPLAQAYRDFAATMN